MKFDAQRALILYAVALTSGSHLVWPRSRGSGQQVGQVRHDRCGSDQRSRAGRHLADDARFGCSGTGFVTKGKEYPRPDRRMAGMLFFDDEGTETGGLIFAGKDANGKASGGGSLTFDRYHQDQVVQLFGFEEGQERSAASR